MVHSVRSETWRKRVHPFTGFALCSLSPSSQAARAAELILSSELSGSNIVHPSFPQNEFVETQRRQTSEAGEMVEWMGFILSSSCENKPIMYQPETCHPITKCTYFLIISK